MKQKLMFSLRLAVLAMLGVGSIPATAQTTANGAYYPWPAWDQTLACTALNACPRFVVLSNMSSAAVLDRETGLVWERSPTMTLYTWEGASAYCISTIAVGNRRGWHLPTIQEFESLIDPTVLPVAALPAGHPFHNVQVGDYWSATTSASGNSPAFPYNAWVVQFGIGVGSTGVKPLPKELTLYAWCVRGGQGVDPQ